MPTPTYDLIASNVLTTSATSVTFSSLPSTGYRDLVLVVTAIGATSPQGGLRFNGDTGSNYAWVRATGDGSSASSFSNTTDYARAMSIAEFSTGVGGLNVVQIFDYATTDKHKAVLSRANGSSTAVEMIASRWANTAAITSITYLSGSAREFDSGSTFYLYGISA
jgi:hypothetical protein